MIYNPYNSLYFLIIYLFSRQIVLFIKIKNIYLTFKRWKRKKDNLKGKPELIKDKRGTFL